MEKRSVSESREEKQRRKIKLLVEELDLSLSGSSYDNDYETAYDCILSIGKLVREWPENLEIANRGKYLRFDKFVKL